MDSTNEFITNFHNLEGTTLGEKRRSLFTLLKRLESTKPSSSSISDIVSSLSPRNHLECIFRIEFLIFFKREQELLDVLANGNEELPISLFRQAWFFQKAFKDPSTETIVNEMLPCLSLVNRNRVIRSLARYHKNETKIDEIFFALLEKYGISSAKLIISGCSIVKIKKILESHQIRLSSRDLVPIFNKNKQLLETYTSYCDLDPGDHRILREVAMKDTDMYFYIRPQSSLQLSKEITLRFLERFKEEVICSTPEYLLNLHLKTVYDNLSDREASSFLENLFPDKIEEFRYAEIRKFLKYFPGDERFKVYAQTFKKKYNQTIWAVKQAHVDEVFEIMSDAEDRETFINKKIKSGSPHKNFYQYYDINTAIRLIVEKLNVTSAVRSRADLAEKLIFACEFNNNLAALNETLEYFSIHHRNDEKFVKQSFLNALSMKFNLSDLTNEYWKFINEILEVQRTKSEEFDNRKHFLLQYILFLSKNKQPYTEKIVDLITKDGFNASDLNLLNGLKHKELERDIIVRMIELLPTVIEEKSVLLEEDVKIILWLKKWNKNHRKKKKNNEGHEILLTQYPRLISSLKTYTVTSLNTARYIFTLEALFCELLCNKEIDETYRYLTDIYFEDAIKRYQRESIILWYFKYDPTVLSKYCNNVVKSICECDLFTWKTWSYVKTLSHLGIYEKCIDYCVKNYASSHSVSHMLQVLAFLMSPEDFRMLVSKHAPTTERLNMDDDASSKANYEIQRAVAGSLKYTRSFVLLPTILSFCMGGYLKDALQSLYYLFYHSPENKLGICVEQLSCSRAVSVRKHALFLTAQVGTIENVFSVLKASAENETNAWMKKHVLSINIRYFLKNQSNKLFRLLLSCISAMNVLDSETVKAISRVGAVPKQYRAEYFIFVLNRLNIRAEQNKELSDEADNLLSQADEDLLQILPYGFCTLFIDKHFLPEDDCYAEVNRDLFVVNFLFRCEYDYIKKLEYVIDKIANYQQDVKTFEQKTVVSKRINNFLLTLSSNMKIYVSITKLKICLDKIFGCLKSEDYFVSYMEFNILLMQLESRNNTTQYSKRIYTFFNENVTKYGPLIMKLFSCCVRDMTPSYKLLDEYFQELCWKLWNLNQTVENCLLIIHLLPWKPPVQEENRENYFKMLEGLESRSDKSVKILLKDYINAMT